jgi:hypothetical protein
MGKGRIKARITKHSAEAEITGPSTVLVAALVIAGLVTLALIG